MHLESVFTPTNMQSPFCRGSAIIVAATTSITLAMSWGGIQYSWTSWKILLPLLLGVAGAVAFCFYEFNWAREPVMPWELVSNRTSLFGYIMTFLHGVAMINVACELRGSWL